MMEICVPVLRVRVCDLFTSWVLPAAKETQPFCLFIFKSSSKKNRNLDLKIAPKITQTSGSSGCLLEDKDFFLTN